MATPNRRLNKRKPIDEKTMNEGNTSATVDEQHFFLGNWIGNSTRLLGGGLINGSNPLHGSKTGDSNGLRF